MSAIWAKFSFMNHSCCVNTNRFSIGDFLFVRSIKPIKQGEEVLTTYIPIDLPYEEKIKFLSFYKFACACENCVAMKNLTMEQQDLLREIWKEIKTKVTSKEQAEAKMKYYIEIEPKVEELFGDFKDKFYMAEIHIYQ